MTNEDMQRGKMSRGRKPGFEMSDEHRGKIRNSNILRALIEHVEGKREMSATQVSAGLGLLRKTLPDLSAIEMDVEAKTQFIVSSIPMTDEEWLAEYGAEPEKRQ